MLRPAFLLPMVLLALAASAGAAPTADFDWTMPDRYGIDADGDGLLDERTDAASVTPAAFTVRLDACASTGSIVQYLWDVDGVSIPDTDCTLAIDFAEEGVHQVSLTVTDDQGATARTSRRVVVQDFLVVGLGDSLASGEGNPVVPADLSDLSNVKEPRWQSRQCHRSEIAGQARAALRLERDDPRTSVTFVHLACSGATVPEGLLGYYDGIEPRPGDVAREPQVFRAAQLANGREIDAVMLSIGANDLEFGEIVTTCMSGVDCHDDAAFVRDDLVARAVFELLCATLGVLGLEDECLAFLPPAAESGEARFQRTLPRIQDRYLDLSDGLATRLPGLAADRVYVAAYPQLTRDESGSLCVQDPIGFSLEETRWADGVVTAGLNDAIAAAAGDRGWNFVGGMADAFRLHGYCSSQSWVRRIEDSVVLQLNHNGSVHPTAAGHAAYRDFLHAALVQDLYAGGDLSKPRDPQTPPIADAGGPYQLAEGSSVRLRNGSSDPAGDPLQYLWANVSAGPVSFSDVRAAEPLLSGADDADGLISLTVSDGTGNDVDTAKVVVSNVAPVVDLSSSPQTGSEGLPYGLVGSFQDAGALDTHGGSIVWGDGATSALPGLASPGSAFSGQHVFAEDGVYDVVATVVDDDGGVGAATRTVQVRNLPPTDLVVTDLAAAPEGSTSAVGVSFRDPGTRDTHTASFDWGDGTAGGPVPVTSPFQGSHAYLDDGSFAVTVTVSDDDGGAAQVGAAVTVANLPPVAGPGSGSGSEGAEATLTLAFQDPGALDTHRAEVDWGDGSPIEAQGPVSSPLRARHVYVEDGVHPATVRILDDDGGETTAPVDVSVANVAPEVDAAAGSGTEGSPVALDVAFADPGVLDTHTARVDWGDGSVEDAGAVASPFSAVHTYRNEGSWPIRVTVSDDDGGAGLAAASASVANAPPVVGALTGLGEPIRLGDAVTATADFQDAGVLDTHTAGFDWGDGSGSAGVVTESGGSGTVSGSHTYAAPGVYTVTLTVADDAGDAASTTFEFAVVYDPEGGFVTGAGSIDSPPGAFVADPVLTGVARFGFTARYRKGANVPDGHTEFRFVAGELRFESRDYEWLVVSGATARYKGSGSLDGRSGYGFLLFAYDGDRGPRSEADRFRIKIWEEATGQVVYDNQAGEDDDGLAATVLRQGRIAIHE